MPEFLAMVQKIQLNSGGYSQNPARHGMALCSVSALSVSEDLICRLSLGESPFGVLQTFLYMLSLGCCYPPGDSRPAPAREPDKANTSPAERAQVLYHQYPKSLLK